MTKSAALSHLDTLYAWGAITSEKLKAAAREVSATTYYGQKMTDADRVSVLRRMNIVVV